MRYALVLSIIGISSVSHAWLPDAVRISHKLSPVEREFSQFGAEFVRSTDESRLRIRGRVITPSQGEKEAGPGFQPAMTKGLHHGSGPSGHPLGMNASWRADINVQVRATGPYEYTLLTFTGKSWKDGVARGFDKIDGPREAPLAEVVSRYGLAHFAARRLQADGNVTIGGRSYPALKATGTNARYIDFAAWASANNLVVGSGQDGTIKSFTKSGVLWIVPLAANKIKKGAAWQTLPDLVMRKDGKIYIPVVALTQS